MPAKGEYDVGKGKPPKHTRFQKGQSGNPSGLPGPVKTLQGALLAEDRGRTRRGLFGPPV